VLSRASALCAITAPSRVSYLRLTPHRWSAGGAFLAEHNREAMLRMCPTPSLAGGDPRRSLHLEYRAADATANPWLALGVLVRAGIAGLEADDAAEVWPESATEDQLGGVPRLPADLESALAALEADPVARGWFPDELWETYLLVRRWELAELAELDDTDACSRLSRIY
jgi:glutamine synthetase